MFKVVTEFYDEKYQKTFLIGDEYPTEDAGRVEYFQVLNYIKPIEKKSTKKEVVENG